MSQPAKETANSAAGTLEQRVLVLAPTREDAQMCQAMLHAAGLAVTICGEFLHIFCELQRGAAALLLTEEALTPDQLAELTAVLEHQPPWSDLPVLVLTRGGAESPLVAQLMQQLQNVVLLERPVQRTTLPSSVRAAVKSRQRQYQLREHLAEQKRQQEALRESEERLRGVEDNLPNSAVYQYMHEADGTPRFLYFSAGVERINGVSVPEVLRDAGTLLGQILPEYRQRLVEAEARSAGELSDFEMELPMRRPDGVVRWVRLRSRPRRLPGGRVVWDGVENDITRHKQAEDALRLSEEKFARAFTGNPAAMTLTRPDGRFVDANDSWLALNGYSREELKSASVNALLFWPTPEERARFVRELQAKGSVSGWEQQLRKRSGELFISQLSAQMLTLAGEELILSAYVDITERKRAEADRHLLTEVLRALNRGGDLHGVIRETLRLIQEATGFDAVGLRLRQGEDYPYFEHKGFSQEFLQEENLLCQRGGQGEVARDAEGRATLECTCGLVVSGRTDPRMPCFTEGGSFWSNLSSELLALPPESDPRTNPRNRCIHQGYQSVGLFPVRAGVEIVGLLQLNDRREGRFTPERVVFWESVAQNIGLALQRATAEEALRASEQRFRTVAENAQAVVGIVQGNRFVYANPYLAQISGYSNQEILGMDFANLVRPDYGPMVSDYARRRQLGEAVPTHYEFAMLTREGQTRWIDLSVGLIVYEGKQGIVGTGYDVTQRKEAEESLAAAKHEAERANAAKDHFLAVLSHELRTPLAPVVPALEELSNIVPPELREELEMARRNVNLEARLIDDLLDVTRISRGKIELNRELCDLPTILRRAAEVCAPDIEARRLRFGMELEGGPYPVDADPARLQQVFWNLIKNAIKFTPHGGCVGIACHSDGNGRVMVEVKDSGIGMDPPALDKVFNAFEQVDRSITQHFGGLGLGLAISKALVEMHGGSIEAQSPGKGQGATFTVKLPLYQVAGLPPAERTAESTPAKPPRPLRILLVEDHGDTARMMKRLLQAEGHTVETAGDVAGALEAGRAREFDLLLSDLGLPDGSGLDISRALSSEGRPLPAIALSGYGQERDIQQAREAGFAAHLTKPVSKQQILSAIAAVAQAQ